jgi:hemoglobin
MTHADRIPLTQPRAVVNEAMIERLVHAFYARVLQDEVLAPVFQARLSAGWDAHLAKMVDFWSSIALSTGRYGGKPHVAHQPLGLSPSHFSRWLSLFESTAQAVCGDAAPFFVDRAHRIADSFMISLNIGPKALDIPGVSAQRR